MSWKLLRKLDSQWLCRSNTRFTRSFHASRIANIFIQTENTPNPQSLKFLPQEKEVLPSEFGTGIHFDSPTVNSLSRANNQDKVTYSSPLVSKLFKEVSGVKSVFLGNNFISITKQPTENWTSLKPAIFSLIFDHYASNQDMIVQQEQKNGAPSEKVSNDTTILDSDDEVVAAIKELIETRVRPSVQEDGGDIFYAGFDPETGLVKVQLAGSCVGCPSSSVTLRNGVENMLMHYIPEVRGIIEVGESGDEMDSSPLKLEFQPEAVSSNELK